MPHNKRIFIQPGGSQREGKPSCCTNLKMFYRLSISLINHLSVRNLTIKIEYFDGAEDIIKIINGKTFKKQVGAEYHITSTQEQDFTSELATFYLSLIHI